MLKKLKLKNCDENCDTSFNIIKHTKLQVINKCIKRLVFSSVGNNSATSRTS